MFNLSAVRRTMVRVLESAAIFRELGVHHDPSSAPPPKHGIAKPGTNQSACIRKHGGSWKDTSADPQV